MVEYDNDQLRDAIFTGLSDGELREKIGEGVRGRDKVVLNFEKTYLSLD